MPCYKCNNNKYKYGLKGDCVFDTLERCQAAERAIHARENKTANNWPFPDKPCSDCGPKTRKTNLKKKVM